MNILSIQSHVAYGHVGNSAATFPLQRMGFEVWPVHTVMFSNHAGYDSFKGPVMSPKDVGDVISGIEDRGAFKDCSAVLSGYLGDSPLGEIVLQTVEKIRHVNPNMTYCCDPVMGDVGSDIYVRETIPPFLKNKAVKAADIITPNLFELELLAGRTLNSLQEIIFAAREQLNKGPQFALVTSVVRDGIEDGVVEMLAVDAQDAYLIETPQLSFDIIPNGAGDVTAALFLAYQLKGYCLKDTLAHVARSVYAMFSHSQRQNSRELAVIAAQDTLLEEEKPFLAKAVCL